MSAVAASTRGYPAVAGPSSRPMSTSTPRCNESDKDMENITIPREKLEKLMPKGDVGHDLVKGDAGSHGKRTLKDFSMENKVCVVTGAARGLGNLMARTFIESGSDTVAFLDLSAEDAQQAAQDANAWFEEHGDAAKGSLNLIGVKCDVASEEDVKAAFSKIHNHFGRIDVVVNSAGIVENFPSTEYPTERYKKVSREKRSP